MVQLYNQGKEISFTGDVQLVEDNPGNIVIQMRRLVVSNKYGWETKPDSPNGPYYIGYIQVILENRQSNHYGPTVEQRWEFDQLPLSDSISPTQCPWYGIDQDPFIPALRRAQIGTPGEEDRNGQVVLGMTDDFRLKVAKYESLANGAPGPNMLTQIERYQKFRTWLVLVSTDQVGNLSAYSKWRCLSCA
jgi:hypothetical protein